MIPINTVTPVEDGSVDMRYAIPKENIAINKNVSANNA